MLQVVLNPVPDPVEASYAALFGWLRAPAGPQRVEFRVFDERLYHELHPRTDIADLFPSVYSTGFYAIVSVADYAERIEANGYRLPFSVAVDGVRHINQTVRVSVDAIAQARQGATHKRAKRAFLIDRLACTVCGAALSASIDAVALNCGACGATFDQKTEALNLVAGNEHIPRIVNTSVFDYSEDERRVIDQVSAAGGHVLDFGAGLRAQIEPRVVNVEIADYPTTDVVSMSDRLPFQDNVFEAVITLHVLEHVRHPWISAREMVRVLKPGGTIVCTVPFVCAEHGFPDHYFNMTRSGLLSLFDGLQVERQFVKSDGVPINGVQQILATYWGNLDEPYRSQFGALTVDQILKTPLHDLITADYAAHLPPHAIWKVAAHTSLVLRKPVT